MELGMSANLPSRSDINFMMQGWFGNERTLVSSKPAGPQLTSREMKMTGRYTSDFGPSDFGPNVEQILAKATRVVRGSIRRRVRAELMTAVKAGVLGRLKKDGLKPEIFFHPDHKNEAIELLHIEAEYAIKCISTVIAVRPVAERIDEAFANAGREPFFVLSPILTGRHEWKAAGTQMAEIGCSYDSSVISVSGVAYTR
jgi:hypothetical protein